MALQVVAQKGGFVHPPGHPKGLTVDSIATLFKSLSEVLAALGPDNRVNIYYTLAHHAGLHDSQPSRTGSSFEYQTVLAFDIDHVDTAQPQAYLVPIAKVLQVEPANLILVCSGNGVQILTHLKTPIRSLKYLKELKPAYNELCHKIQKQLNAAGLPGKVDPVIFDAARVLRLPGTINRKPGKPDKECVLLQYSDAQHDIDLMEISGLTDLIQENVSPEQIRRQYPKPDFAEMVKECRFVQWALEKPEEVHEPQAFDLFSLLAAQPPAAKVDFQGKEQSAVELAEHVFNHATSSQSLARGEFRDKWESSSRYGARKCSTVASNWIGGCETCPHFSKIPTPLALKSDAHISSEELGFWMVDKNGRHLHPHYSDLTKIYARDHSFVVTGGENLYSFEDAHYIEAPLPFLKSWLDKKVVPNDPLMDRHCSEFVKKVLRTGMLNPAGEDFLFNQSTVGKLNCKNGVVDILTGELLPHSSQYGFRYILPYDYVAEESSELFLDWLETITKSRVELMDSIMDMMAYVLWPSYDDHVFAYLIGDGANGKSTLLHIIQAMIGRGNFSAVSLQQLGGNRFAPAQLEGKLANLSEESSGYEMTVEEMNVIKNLSAGGEMMAEHKGVKGFLFQNKAKLIFSANKPPKFREDGVAIQRRMMVIPFDHQITNPDANVEKQLIAEVPKIVAMLVRRIQVNVKHNAGKFIVARGGAAAAEAQRKLLMSGNNVVEWGKERLESSADLGEADYVGVSDAFSDYLKWCQINNQKPVNNVYFSRSMYKYVVNQTVDASKNLVQVGGKAKRVFKKMKWKDEE